MRVRPEPSPGAAHLEHLAAAAAELLDDDADERLRHVDDDLLVRLEVSPSGPFFVMMRGRETANS
jgi:hypothetical protein